MIQRLLVASLCLGVMFVAAGCGNDDTSDSKSNGSKSTATDDSTEETVGDSAEESAQPASPEDVGAVEMRVKDFVSAFGKRDWKTLCSLVSDDFDGGKNAAGEDLSCEDLGSGLLEKLPVAEYTVSSVKPAEGDSVESVMNIGSTGVAGDDVLTSQVFTWEDEDGEWLITQARSAE